MEFRWNVLLLVIEQTRYLIKLNIKAFISSVSLVKALHHTPSMKAFCVERFLGANHDLKSLINL